MCIYIYIHIYIHIYIYTIYVNTFIGKCMCKNMYICVYVERHGRPCTYTRTYTCFPHKKMYICYFHLYVEVENVGKCICGECILCKRIYIYMFT